MRNVRVVSFKDGIIEAGTATLRTRRETVIQEDQLYPYAITKHAADLAIANMDGNLEMIGDNADPAVLRDLGWSVPESILEEAGLSKTRESVGGALRLTAPPAPEKVVAKPEVPPVPAAVEVKVEKPEPKAEEPAILDRAESKSKKKHNR